MQGIVGNQATLQREERIMARFEAFHQAHTQGSASCPYRSRLLPRIDSQDTWIFRSPLPQLSSKELEFELGRSRCDNRLAASLLDAGLTVTSPSFAIPTHHLHHHHHGEKDEQQRRYGYTGQDQVNGKLAFVMLSDQWLF